MFKVAFLAATLAAAASTPMAADFVPAAAPPADDAPCRLVQSRDLACTTRAIDANGDGTLSAAEPAGFAAPASADIDWASPHPQQTGLDFREAALEATPVLSAARDPDGSHRLVPALFALGGLVILLRGRPT
jgi:hypothetical protein